MPKYHQASYKAGYRKGLEDAKVSEALLEQTTRENHHLQQANLESTREIGRLHQVIDAKDRNQVDLPRWAVEQNGAMVLLTESMVQQIAALRNEIAALRANVGG